MCDVMVTITATVIGAKEVKRIISSLSRAVRKEESGVAGKATEFVNNYWKPGMPKQTGFLKGSTVAIGQGKGKAMAFTQTFRKKSKGYAIFPEIAKKTDSLGRSYNWTRPHYTQKALDKFTPKYFKDAELNIDRALGK